MTERVAVLRQAELPFPCLEPGQTTNLLGVISVCIRNHVEAVETVADEPYWTGYTAHQEGYPDGELTDDMLVRVNYALLYRDFGAADAGDRDLIARVRGLLERYDLTEKGSARRFLRGADTAKRDGEYIEGLHV
jgi:hypothetical protein